MIISYLEIYSRMLGKIVDYDFLSLSKETAYEFMHDWLSSALSKPYVRKIFSSIKIEDEIMEIDFVLKNSVDEYFDKNFVVEVLSQGTMIEWLEPKVNSTANIAQFFGGKEEKFYSQSNHLSVLIELLDKTKISQRKLIRDFGYQYNSYIGEDL